jgi:hypothetical protein
MSGEEDATLNEPTNYWLRPKIGRGRDTVRYDGLAEEGLAERLRTQFARGLRS